MAMLNSVSDMDLKLLRVFMSVVQCGGFAAAQSVLNVTQSNISMQMKQLEERLGMKLCHRGRGGFWLTEEGKEVYDACKTLFRSIEEFRSAVSSSSGQLGGRLHIAVIDNAIFNDSFRLSEAIALAKDDYANFEVELNVVVPNTVEQMVLDGSCDLGIGFYPTHRQSLEYAPLFTSHMHLYCGNRHSLFERAPNDLVVDEVLAAPHAARGYVSSAQLPSFEKKFMVGGSSSSVEGLATLILTGRFTAYLPAHYANHWVTRGEMREILPDQISYSSLYEIAYKRESLRSRLLQSFLNQLTELHLQVDVEGDFGIGTVLDT